MIEERSDISLRYFDTATFINQSGALAWQAVVRGISGFLLASAIGYAAWRRGSLDQSGFAGAVVSGTLTTARGGYGRAALLVGFFVASSLITRLSAPADSGFERFTAKGGRRDAWQVAANGGVALLIALLGPTERFRLEYLGSLAAATGDTWATEIGRRLGGKPRGILTMQVVEPGTSGAVSLPGTIASVAGGIFLGALAVATGRFDPAFRDNWKHLLITGVLAGVVGSLIDSLAGALFQELRRCDHCAEFTERSIHTCGHRTRITGGIPGLNNDGVNLVCTLAGALTGWLVSRSVRD
jgi:uncharacterized protein (TIGR00297 family)